MLFGLDLDFLSEGKLARFGIPNRKLDAGVVHELHRPVLSEEVLDPALHLFEGVVAVLVVGSDLDVLLVFELCFVDFAFLGGEVGLGLGLLLILGFLVGDGCFELRDFLLEAVFACIPYCLLEFPSGGKEGDVSGLFATKGAELVLEFVLLGEKGFFAYHNCLSIKVLLAAFRHI